MTQYTSTTSRWYPEIELVPPLAKDFNVYGSKETVERARKWALDHKYLLVRGIDTCAHGIYMMYCPRRPQGCNLKTLDHANWWISLQDRRNIFLLAHPYINEPEKDDTLLKYAQAHGLSVFGSDHLDGWYKHGSSPVRLTAHKDTAYPIDREIAICLTLSPISWPKTEGHYGQDTVDFLGDGEDVE